MVNRSISECYRQEICPECIHQECGGSGLLAKAEIVETGNSRGMKCVDYERQSKAAAEAAVSKTE